MPFSNFKDQEGSFRSDPPFHENSHQQSVEPSDLLKQQPSSVAQWSISRPNPLQYNYLGDQSMINNQMPGLIQDGHFPTSNTRLGNTNQHIRRPTAVMKCNCSGRAYCNHAPRGSHQWNLTAENPVAISKCMSQFQVNDPRIRSSITGNIDAGITDYSRYPRDVTSGHHGNIPLYKEEMSSQDSLPKHQPSGNLTSAAKDTMYNCLTGCSSNCLHMQPQASCKYPGSGQIPSNVAQQQPSNHWTNNNHRQPDPWAFQGSDPRLMMPIAGVDMTVNNPTATEYWIRNQLKSNTEMPPSFLEACNKHQAETYQNIQKRQEVEKIKRSIENPAKDQLEPVSWSQEALRSGNILSSFPIGRYPNNRMSSHSSRPMQTHPLPLDPYSHSRALQHTYNSDSAQIHSRLTSHATYTHSKITKGNYFQPLILPAHSNSYVSHSLDNNQSAHMNVNSEINATKTVTHVQYVANKKTYVNQPSCNEMYDNIDYGQSMQVVDNPCLGPMKNVPNYHHDISHSYEGMIDQTTSNMSANVYYDHKNMLSKQGGYNSLYGNNTLNSMQGSNRVPVPSGMMYQPDAGISGFKLPQNVQIQHPQPNMNFVESDDTNARPPNKKRKRQDECLTSSDTATLSDVRTFYETWNECEESDAPSSSLPAVLDSTSLDKIDGNTTETNNSSKSNDSGAELAFKDDTSSRLNVFTSVIKPLKKIEKSPGQVQGLKRKYYSASVQSEPALTVPDMVDLHSTLSNVDGNESIGNSSNGKIPRDCFQRDSISLAFPENVGVVLPQVKRQLVKVFPMENQDESKSIMNPIDEHDPSTSNADNKKNEKSGEINHLVLLTDEHEQTSISTYSAHMADNEMSSLLKLAEETLKVSIDVKSPPIVSTDSMVESNLDETESLNKSRNSLHNTKSKSPIQPTDVCSGLPGLPTNKDVNIEKKSRDTQGPKVTSRMTLDEIAMMCKKNCEKNLRESVKEPILAEPILNNQFSNSSIEVVQLSQTSEIIDSVIKYISSELPLRNENILSPSTGLFKVVPNENPESDVVDLSVRPVNTNDESDIKSQESTTGEKCEENRCSIKNMPSLEPIYNPRYLDTNFTNSSVGACTRKKQCEIESDSSFMPMTSLRSHSQDSPTKDESQNIESNEIISVSQDSAIRNRDSILSNSVLPGKHSNIDESTDNIELDQNQSRFKDCKKNSKSARKYEETDVDHVSLPIIVHDSCNRQNKPEELKDSRIDSNNEGGDILPIVNKTIEVEMKSSEESLKCNEKNPNEEDVALFKNGKLNFQVGMHIDEMTENNEFNTQRPSFESNTDVVLVVQQRDDISQVRKVSTIESNEKDMREAFVESVETDEKSSKVETRLEFSQIDTEKMQTSKNEHLREDNLNITSDQADRNIPVDIFTNADPINKAGKLTKQENHSTTSDSKVWSMDKQTLSKKVETNIETAIEEISNDLGEFREGKTTLIEPNGEKNSGTGCFKSMEDVETELQTKKNDDTKVQLKAVEELEKTAISHESKESIKLDETLNKTVDDSETDESSIIEESNIFLTECTTPTANVDLEIMEVGENIKDYQPDEQDHSDNLSKNTDLQSTEIAKSIETVELETTSIETNNNIELNKESKSREIHKDTAVNNIVADIQTMIGFPKENYLETTVSETDIVMCQIIARRETNYYTYSKQVPSESKVVVSEEAFDEPDTGVEVVKSLSNGHLDTEIQAHANANFEICRGKSIEDLATEKQDEVEQNPKHRKSKKTIELTITPVYLHTEMLTITDEEKIVEESCENMKLETSPAVDSFERIVDPPSGDSQLKVQSSSCTSIDENRLESKSNTDLKSPINEVPVQETIVEEPNEDTDIRAAFDGLIQVENHVSQPEWDEKTEPVDEMNDDIKTEIQTVVGKSFEGNIKDIVESFADESSNFVISDVTRDMPNKEMETVEENMRKSIEEVETETQETVAEYNEVDHLENYNEFKTTLKILGHDVQLETSVEGTIGNIKLDSTLEESCENIEVGTTLEKSNESRDRNRILTERSENWKVDVILKNSCEKVEQEKKNESESNQTTLKLGRTWTVADKREKLPSCEDKESDILSSDDSDIDVETVDVNPESNLPQLNAGSLRSYRKKNNSDATVDVTTTVPLWISTNSRPLTDAEETDMPSLENCMELSPNSESLEMPCLEIMSDIYSENVEPNDAIDRLNNTAISPDESAMPLGDTVIQLDDPAISLQDSTVPLDDSTVPLDDSTNPFDYSTVPLDDSTVPFDDSTVPLDESSVPLDDSTIPLDDSTNPFDYSTVLLDDSTVPFDNSTVPLDKSTVPLDESTIPLGNSTNPFDYSTVPLDDSTIPLDHSTIPLNNSAVPFDDSTVPLDDSVIPIDISNDSVVPNNEPVFAPLSNLIASPILVDPSFLTEEDIQSHQSLTLRESNVEPENEPQNMHTTDSKCQPPDETISSDPVHDWPYLEEEVFSETPRNQSPMIVTTCSGHLLSPFPSSDSSDSEMPLMNDFIDVPSRNAPSIENSNVKSSRRITNLKCRLSWDKIFNLSSNDETKKKQNIEEETKNRKEPSRRWPSNLKSNNNKKKNTKKFDKPCSLDDDIATKELDIDTFRLELGPAKIEVRLTHKQLPEQWQVVDCPKSDTPSVLFAEENNNVAADLDSRSSENSTSGKLPIVFVKRIVLKRRAEEDSSIWNNLMTLNPLECEQESSCLTTPPESDDSSNNHITPLLPKVIIKRMGHGNAKYQSFLRVSSGEDSHWQPVVRLERRRSIENLARGLLLEMESTDLDSHSEIPDDAFSNVTQSVDSEFLTEKQVAAIHSDLLSECDSDGIKTLINNTSAKKHSKETKSFQLSQKKDKKKANTGIKGKVSEKNIIMNLVKTSEREYGSHSGKARKISKHSPRRRSESWASKGKIVQTFRNRICSEGKTNDMLPRLPKKRASDDWMSDEQESKITRCELNEGSGTERVAVPLVDQCRVCDRVFSDERDKAKHVKVHPYHCQRCNLAFKSENDFEIHLVANHPHTKELHHCLLCKLHFPTSLEHQQHLSGREHRHLDLSQRWTIQTLFTMFTGTNCARITPLTDMEMAEMNTLTDAEPGAINYYHQATPLQLAVQELLIRDKRLPGDASLSMRRTSQENNKEDS